MQMDWTVEVPQAKGPETTETVRSAHGCSTGHIIRNDDLAAVADGDDTSRLVDRVGDVVTLVWICEAAVDAHPNSDGGILRPRFGPKRRLPCGTGTERRVDGAERDEERITIGLDLYSTPRVPRVPQKPTMTFEEPRIAVSDPMEQTRRAFDVGEHEGDDPAWQRGHAQIIADGGRRLASTMRRRFGPTHLSR
jgi:hypothetical protein